MTAGEAVNQLMAVPIRSDLYARTPSGELFPLRVVKVENGYGLPFSPSLDQTAIIVLEGDTNE